MAKVSIIEREKRRERIVRKYADKRRLLKATIKDPHKSYDERLEAQVQLQRLPRNASPVRLQRRCRLTGRPHAVYRKFGFARNKLRESVMQGEVPGLVKSSW